MLHARLHQPLDVQPVSTLDRQTALFVNLGLITVSATPLPALTREWTEHGLAEYMHVIAGQEMGSKAEHVQYAARASTRTIPTSC